jgi:hypothetical protein
MSFSGKQKKAALQEKREKDRLREQQEAARVKAMLVAQEQERERCRHEIHEPNGGAETAPMNDDDDDDGGIMPVRRNIGASKPPVASSAVAGPAPLSDDDDVGGIVPVRRNIRGAASAVASSATNSASAAPSSASSSATGASSVPLTLGASSSSANKLRTAFARESDELIEARKAASRLPLKREHLSSDGGTRSEDYYATEEVPIPVRPDWTGMTPAQLEANEAGYFNTWLENVYAKYGQERLNHFEHNLEVWRQLWRVCERSDILLVIVDSRQPILNFPPSLYHYITRTLKKPMVLVLNKIDLIPSETVNEWLEYFHATYPKLFVVPFTSFPAERMDKIDHLVKSKAKSVGNSNLRSYMRGVPDTKCVLILCCTGAVVA